MNYEADIKVYGDVDRIIKVFHSETEKKDRSQFKILKKENYALFKITAKDSVALRATLNSISKLLTAYEKLERL